MAGSRKLKINKKGEFNLGVGLNFFGFIAIAIAGALYLIDGIANVGASLNIDLLNRLIKDFAELCLIGGFAIVTIGIYLKNQQGLLRTRFLMSMLAIVFAIAFYIVFNVSIDNAFTVAWINQMCLFLGQYIPIGVILLASAWLIKGIIQSNNTFHAEKCIKADFVAFIFAFLYLVFSIFQFSLVVMNKHLETHLNNWVKWGQEISFILALFIMSAAVLRSTRGFQHHLTKVLTVFALILCVFAIIVCTLSASFKLLADGTIPTSINDVIRQVSYFERTALATGVAIFAFFSLNVYHFAPVRA